MDDAGQIVEVAPKLTDDMLLTPISTTMTTESLDRTIRPEQDTKGDARDQAEGHMTSNTGERRTRQEEDVSDPDRDRLAMTQRMLCYQSQYGHSLLQC